MESDPFGGHTNPKRKRKELPLTCSSGFDYFFFSLCSVCFRHVGQYFFSVSFSPPGLRLRV
jgi:hypothetical protein